MNIDELRALVKTWRNLADQVAADMKGAPGKKWDRPTALEKSRMLVQINTLNSCAGSLRELIDKNE